jgi:hypothetical protein
MFIYLEQNCHQLIKKLSISKVKAHESDHKAHDNISILDINDEAQ